MTSVRLITSGPTTSRKRPFCVTCVGILFVAAGVVGLVYHGSEYLHVGRIDGRAVSALGLRLLAVIGGIFVLRGANWARWILVLWMTYHVVLSAFHSAEQVAVHVVFLGIVGWSLFGRTASEYFTGQKR